MPQSSGASPTFTTGKEILGVAVIFNCTMYCLPKPNRHHHVLRMIRNTSPKNEKGLYGPDQQGFYDANGLFLDREKAYIRAKETGQLQRDPNPLKYQGNQLFSEDLW